MVVAEVEVVGEDEEEVEEGGHALMKRWRI
jgi:hypothetical protein